MYRRFLDSEDSYERNAAPSEEARPLHKDDVNAEEEEKAIDASGVA